MGAFRTSTSTPLIVIESGSDISKIAMRQNSASDSLGAGTKVFHRHRYHNARRGVAVIKVGGASEVEVSEVFDFIGSFFAKSKQIQILEVTSRQISSSCERCSVLLGFFFDAAKNALQSCSYEVASLPRLGFCSLIQPRRLLKVAPSR